MALENYKNTITCMTIFKPANILYKFVKIKQLIIIIRLSYYLIEKTLNAILEEYI